MSASNGSEKSVAQSSGEPRSGAQVSLSLPPQLVEQIAKRAAALVRTLQLVEPESWLDVPEAAGHLACPTSRIYALVSAGRIPHHRDGSRLLFRRLELDSWVERGGAIRP